MEFIVTQKTAEHFDGDCAVAFIVEGLAHQNADLQQLLEINQFDANVGKTLILNRVDGYKTKRVLVAGIGQSPVTDKNYLKSLKAIFSALASVKAKNIFFPGIEIENRDESWVQLTTARVLQNSIYQIDKVNSDDSTEKNTLEAVSIYSENSDSSNVLKGVAIANGMALTRSLGDLPSNICTPSHLAETAKSLAQSYNLKYEVLE
ncbi:MAG: M17 family peptidase N-terminal domain-containing protein, partial [Gammaproteobacteria bacterium]|nr:M17 family peptidase N-terminal domain-containing protein [Gammaproteobacteria bacterium]